MNARLSRLSDARRDDVEAALDAALTDRHARTAYALRRGIERALMTRLSERARDAGS